MYTRQVTCSNEPCKAPNPPAPITPTVLITTAGSEYTGHSLPSRRRLRRSHRSLRNLPLRIRQNARPAARTKRRPDTQEPLQSRPRRLPHRRPARTLQRLLHASHRLRRQRWHPLPLLRHYQKSIQRPGNGDPESAAEPRGGDAEWCRGVPDCRDAYGAHQNRFNRRCAEREAVS